MPRRAGRVNLSTVARRAGVSPATVSLVLNRPSTARASAATRRRILQAARELGYDTDALRTPARERFAAIAGARILLFVQAQDGGRPYFEPAFAGFRDVAARFDVRLEIGFGPEDLEDPRSVRRYVESGDIAGFMLAGGLPRTAGYLIGERLPVVVLGDFFTPAQPCAQVRLNNFKGGYLAADALISRGHRRIGFAGYPRAGEFHMQRLAGVMQRLHEAGLAPGGELAMCADARHEEPCRGYLDRVLALGDPPTGIVAASSGMCLILLEEAARRKLDVPRDLSVVSFDRIDDPAWAGRITTVEYDMEAMGRLTMNKLVKLLTGSQDELTVELTFPRLVERASVRRGRARPARKGAGHVRSRR